MDKHKLAHELRRRQYDVGLVDRHIIDSLSDDDIIDSYITCSCCGEKQVNAQNLERAIHLAENAIQFIDICNEFAEARYKERHLREQRNFPHKTKTSRRWKSTRTWHRRKNEGVD